MEHSFFYTASSWSILNWEIIEIDEPCGSTTIEGGGSPLREGNYEKNTVITLAKNAHRELQNLWDQISGIKR